MKSASVVLALSLFVCGSFASRAFAQSDRAYTPFMLSFVTPLQVPPRDFDVGGLRINLIYGECHDFDGLDISTVGRATGHANGLQAALLGNVVDGDGFGMQVACVNYVKGEYAGLQVGVANYIEKAKALQIGVYNGAEHVEGMQIGLINTTRTMIGIQIGVVNVIQDNDVPFLPIINCYF
jgi:hypothetical protein